MNIAAPIETLGQSAETSLTLPEGRTPLGQPSPVDRTTYAEWLMPPWTIAKWRGRINMGRLLPSHGSASVEAQGMEVRMPAISELVMRISECEAQLAALVAQEEDAEAKLRAQVEAAAEKIDACFPMWANWQTLVLRRRKLEETLAELLRSMKDTRAETRGDVMAEIEFLARFSEDITTGDDENVLVPRWLLKKVHQEVQGLV